MAKPIPRRPGNPRGTPPATDHDRTFRACIRCFDLLPTKHAYLGAVKPVGERLHGVATDAQDRGSALLLFSAPARHVKCREQWIAWSSEQRRHIQGRIPEEVCLIPRLEADPLDAIHWLPLHRQ